MTEYDDDEDSAFFDGEVSISHRAAQQREYERAYRQFVTTLSPSELADLKQHGFDKPDLDRQRINGKAHSVEDLDLEDREKVQKQNRDILLRAFLELSGRENLLLHLDVILSALGVYDHENVTLEELGEKHGVSKQRFCELRTLFIDAYDLPPPQNGRGLKQRLEEGKTRCKQSNSNSISQRKSASYTPALKGRRSPCWRPGSKLAKS